MEQNEFQRGTIDEKIQTADRHVACVDHSVFFALGRNTSRFCAAFIVLYKLLGKNQKYFLEKY